MGVPWQPQLLAHLAGVVVLAAGALSVLPAPANVSYVFDESSCILSVQWDDGRPSPRDSYKYCTGLCREAVCSDDDDVCAYAKWSEDLSRKMAVPLGENRSFVLQMSCNNCNESEVFKIPLEQNGTAETGATDVSCICHSMEWMACSWKRGRQAPRDTNYHLSFWFVFEHPVLFLALKGAQFIYRHDNLEERQLCTNHSVDRDTFRCVFPINCSGERTLVLSIRSDSEDIQPVCVLTKEDYPIKLYPPSNLKVTKGNNNVIFLTWDAPNSWSGICYQVEVIGTSKQSYEDSTNVTITLEPKKHHTVRVRAVLGNIGSHCKEIRGPWSEWSEPVDFDDRDKFEALHIILFVTIPLCAAALTIILLVYLKRIQLLIFPIIPDPEKVLKRMFEDQREEYLPVEYPSEFIKPDTIKTDYRMS